jgi:hypothetical protein
MNELLPGIFHWRVTHPDIEIDVDSYYVPALQPACLIDPLMPQEGIDWFGERPIPAHIYLTNRLHDRHSQRFKDAFGVTVWCHEAGLHEFDDGSLHVTPFRFHDELPGGVRALQIGVLCPEETGFLLPIAGGVLSIGDAILYEDGELGFAPDSLLGDDPAAIKRGVKAALLQICEQEIFDHVLFAHGGPMIGGGKKLLRTFCQH